MFTDPSMGISGVMDQEVTLASDNFYTKMTTRMQETVDQINIILSGIKDYQFNIIGNPKIYTGGAPDIWSRVFQGVPGDIFTNELPEYRTGGYVKGPGGPTEDKILAKLSDGEYVVKASSVKQYGKNLLDDINNRKFATGGYVSADRAEYAANNRTTYFGGTPTSSAGYRPTTPTSTYSGGTPTYSGGYTQANYQAYSQQRDKLNIQSFSGANWAWDQSKGKWIKLADVKTGAASSGFGLTASGLKNSVDELGFWGSLGMLGSSIKEDPAQMLPFVGSSRIDTSTKDGKDLFAASSLLDVLSFVPGLSLGTWAGRSLLQSARVGSEVGMNTAQDSINNSVNNDTAIAGSGFLERIISYSGSQTEPQPYTRPVLKPTAQQIWQAKRSAMLGLVPIPQVPYAFDPTMPESEQVSVPFSIPTPPRHGVSPRTDSPRQTEEPTDYGKNSRVMRGYSDAWANYVAMSTSGALDPNNPSPQIRSGPGMKSVSDIMPEYHTMGPARARGYNYGLIKIFGNLENAIRWGIKPMAVDPNPTLEEVPLDPSSPYYDQAIESSKQFNNNPYDPDIDKRVSLLQYRDPTKDIDTEIYPSNWAEMSLEERALYKVGRVLGYNQGLGYSTEKSLVDVPEFGRVPEMIENMIQQEGTTPMGLAAKYASDQVPEFTYNKPVGIQNDFAIYEDPSGRVWSSKEILAGRNTFSSPIYPLPPGPEELNGFQSSIQSAVDIATMATGVPDIVTTSILRGVTGAIFNNKDGEGFRSAFGQYVDGKIDLPTAAILGAASSIIPNWHGTELMKPSNWAKWSTPAIGSPEWSGMYEHFTNQMDSQGNYIPNTTSRPGIPIGTLGSNFPNNTGNRGTPLRPVPKKTTFPDWGTGVPRREPGFPTWGSGPGFPTWGTGSSGAKSSLVLNVPDDPIIETGQAAMTPRLYSAYLRSLSQGVKGYVPPLVNPFSINPSAIQFSQDALGELPPGVDRKEVEKILGGLYSPEQMSSLPGVELDPTSRQTVLDMIRLSTTGINFMSQGDYESEGRVPSSVGYYNPSKNDLAIKPITAGDEAFNVEQVYRTLFHELNHSIGYNLGLTDSYKLYPIGNKNPKFDESFKGIQADPDGPYNNQGMQFGIGIEEASAVLSEHIMMRRKNGANYSITNKAMDDLLYGSSDTVDELPFNILNGHLAYNALYYLKNKDNKNSTFTEEEMKYLVDVSAQRFVNEMGGRIDIPTGLSPLELAYMYAPTSLQEVMAKNGVSGTKWKNGGLIKKFAKGGLARVGQENLTLLGEGISDYAKQYTGTPYSSSAAWEDGPKNGWGCATATKWLYDSYAGVDVGHPSLSASQYSSSAGSKVDSKMPGDLLFFYYKNGVNTGNPINHVGMYTGGGSMFHARSPELGTEVTGVDATGMDSARARAGGSAIKRYMPMTIAGMGVPSGKLATGGQVSGKGGPTTDEILAWISNGEYVMNAGAVKHYGKEFMDAVNKGILPEAAMGGMFSSKYPGVVQKMAGGGMLMSKYGKNGMVSSSANVEYNINVNVAGTNASPDEIANRVMQTLKRSEKMKGATIRI
jgi:cell wall-associated NlpC family hydrolase